MAKEKEKLTLREIIIEGLKKFAGEIIGVVLLACFLWAFPSFRSLFDKYKFSEQNESHTEAQKLTESKQETTEAKKQFDRGRNYYYGSGGVKKDRTEAAKYFLKSAEQEYVEAQRYLGMMYSQGDGVKQDYHEALKWYQKAAEHGDAHSQNSVGMIYQNGWGVDKDYAEAVKWYRKAVEQKDAWGQYHLGMMYEYGLGVSQDYSEAVKFYREAAGLNLSPAKNRLKQLEKKGYK